MVYLLRRIQQKRDQSFSVSVVRHTVFESMHNSRTRKASWGWRPDKFETHVFKKKPCGRERKEGANIYVGLWLSDALMRLYFGPLLVLLLRIADRNDNIVSSNMLNTLNIFSASRPWSKSFAFFSSVSLFPATVRNIYKNANRLSSVKSQLHDAQLHTFMFIIWYVIFHTVWV